MWVYVWGAQYMSYNKTAKPKVLNSAQKCLERRHVTRRNDIKRNDTQVLFTTLSIMPFREMTLSMEALFRGQSYKTFYCRNLLIFVIS